MAQQGWIFVSVLGESQGQLKTVRPKPSTSVVPASLESDEQTQHLHPVNCAFVNRASSSARVSLVAIRSQILGGYSPRLLKMLLFEEG